MATCSECPQELDTVRYSRNRVTCSPACGRARTKRLEREKRLKYQQSLRERKCRVCGAMFTPLREDHVTCSNMKCKNTRDRKRQQSVSVVEDMLGPATPLNPMRKCHDCQAMTYNHRCESCLAKHRRNEGAVGMNQLHDYFTGGHCYHDLVVG